ncbi:MAG TPA: uracil-DNA glycosylase [bacterium]|nr:uracil-DNA glycosylase [bacterium]
MSVQSELTQAAELVRRYAVQLARLGVRDFYIPRDALVVRKRGKAKEFEEMAAALKDCTRCGLSARRTQVVFGTGNPETDLVFVGEAPGYDEDVQGEPFVGRAGQLLTKMIAAMGLSRKQVYICNVIKCRPPENRDPLPEEIACCEPFLLKQLEIIRPKVIVALGRFAVQSLLRDMTPITRQRGRWRDYHGIRLMPTFHPSYLLRNPAAKREVWEDLQEVMRELGLPLPDKKT